MTIQPQTVLGRDLRVGDVVELWIGKQTITDLFPYVGPLSHLWEKDGGARIAAFAATNLGMTIEPIARFTVLNRPTV